MDEVFDKKKRWGFKRIVKFSIFTSLAAAGAVMAYSHYINKDDQIEINRNVVTKKLVVLGSGWGAYTFLKSFKPRQYDPQTNTLTKYEVTVVSPTNYFLFTPLLPSATVGTLETNSITEPIHRLLHSRFRSNSNHTNFYEARATSVDPQKSILFCESSSTNQPFELPYDYLIIATGSSNNTFNTPGVTENCFFVKTIHDAKQIRNGILERFERANIPSLSTEEKKKSLHFVVVGGGPTGVEFAGELCDFIHEDLIHIYPDLNGLPQITLVQSAEKLLNTYSEAISKMAIESFNRQNIVTKINSRVIKVEPEKITLFDKGEKREEIIDYGMCVWSTGIAPTQFTKHVITSFPNQPNKFAITTDPFLRVNGFQNIFAIGDCATIKQDKLIDHLRDLFEAADENKDGELQFSEFIRLINMNIAKFPQLLAYRTKLTKLFHKYDVNNDKSLSLEEFEKLLRKVDSKLTALPATAQVAAQQANYLSYNFHSIVTPQVEKEAYPFQYKSMGSLAYLGGRNAVFDGSIVSGGFSTWFLWRSAYLWMQYTPKSITNITFDWTKELLFGRNVARD